MTMTTMTTAQITMLRRWNVVCATFEVSLEEGFSAMRWVSSVHAQDIHIGCECGCGGDSTLDAIKENPLTWELGEAMNQCRTH